MATVIDSLVVTLGLDPSKYGSGISKADKQLADFEKKIKSLGIHEDKLDASQKKALKSLRDLATQSTRTSKELAATSDVGAQLWSVMEKGALAFGAALGVNAIKDFTVASVQANAAMTRLGPNMGLAAKEADAWGKAVATSVGGNAQQALGALQGISNAINSTPFGVPPAALIAMGAVASRYNGGRAIPALGPNGQPRSAESFLLDLADPLKAMGPQKAQAFGAQFGLDSDTVNFLDRGRAAAEADLATARKATLNQGQFEEDEKLRKASAELATQFNHLKDVMVVLAAPALTLGLKNLAALMTAWTDHDWNKYDATVRANDAAAHDTPDDPGGKKWLAMQDAKAALALVQNPSAAAISARPLSRFAPPAAVQWTDAQKLARLQELLMQGNDAAHAAAVVSQEMAAGRNPDQGNVAPLGNIGGGVTDDLLDRVRRAETGSNPNQTSSAGAQGPYQLMPATGAALGVTDPFNEGQARTGARKLLTQLLARYKGDRRKALAAYNWRPAALDADISQHHEAWAQYLPAETSAYLNNVLGGPAASGGGTRTASAGGDTTIHQNGDITINVPSGDPHAIAGGWHKAVVDQAQSGPS